MTGARPSSKETCQVCFELRKCRTRYCGRAGHGFVCSSEACRAENVKRKEAAKLTKGEAIRVAREARQAAAQTAAQSMPAVTQSVRKRTQVATALVSSVDWHAWPPLAAMAATAAAIRDVLSNPHLLASILEHCAARDLAHAAAVSRSWGQEGCANALWRPHCLKHFPQLAGLLVSAADCRRLFVGQSRSLHRPFRAPTVPALAPHGLRFLVHIERAPRRSQK